MSPDTEEFFRGTMSGSQRGLAAGALRLTLSAMEPFYAGAMILRNRMYDAGLRRVRRLPRAVISIGNLTTGGTGKTPMVRWLAQQLRGAGHKPAVLSRGYKSVPGELGDEQLMLDRMLNGADVPPVVLRANPDRRAAADAALKDRGDIDVFLLDDAFQHRRIHRDLDIVLLNATDPFGFGHVLPRGMLREPIGGLRRAGAVVITHADQSNDSTLADIERRVRRSSPSAPIYRAVHAQVGLRSAGASSAAASDRSLADLQQMRFFAFCGIGNPAVFQRQLESMGGACVGSRWFADHHAYSDHDLAALRQEAAARSADVLLTTEKDWVKVAQLADADAGAGKPDIWRIDVELQLIGDGASRLFEQVLAAIGR